MAVPDSDAERLAGLRKRLAVYAPADGGANGGAWYISDSDTSFLLRLIDERDAEIARLRSQAAPDVSERLPEAEQLIPYTWRTQPDYEAVLVDVAAALMAAEIRSQAALGEDAQERARQLGRDWGHGAQDNDSFTDLAAAAMLGRARDAVEAFPSHTFNRAHAETLVKEVASALTAVKREVTELLNEERRHHASQGLEQSHAILKSRQHLIAFCRAWAENPAAWNKDEEDRDFRQIRYIAEGYGDKRVQEARVAATERAYAALDHRLKTFIEGAKFNAETIGAQTADELLAALSLVLTEYRADRAIVVPETKPCR